MPYWIKLKNDKPFCLVISGEKIKTLMAGFKRWDDTKQYWTFDQAGYTDAMTKYVKKVASQYGEVESIDTLPYAASPVKTEKPGEESYEWTLCYSPDECCGKSACPKNRSCSE